MSFMIIWSICWLIRLVASVQNSSTSNPWFWIEEREPHLWQYCQYHEQLIFEAHKNACPHIDCWESQLTDKSRFNLVLSYNIYRYQVAMGLCKNCKHNGSATPYQNMNYMEYHWYLELVAQDLLKTKCEFSIPATPITLDVAKLKDAQKLLPKCKSFEYAATSMPFPFETQTEWINQLYENLDPPTLRKLNFNILGDWDENRKLFRRGTANFFGCAIAVRSRVSGITGIGVKVHNERVIHLLCVYATLSQWYTKPGPYFDLSQNCDIPMPNFIGLGQIKYIKDVKHQSAICRRATLLEEMDNDKKPFVMDIPCAVYSKSLENSIFYHPPCPGAPTRTWSDSSLPHYQPVLPFFSNTPFDNLVTFELADQWLGVESKLAESKLAESKLAKLKLTGLKLADPKPIEPEPEVPRIETKMAYNLEYINERLDMKYCLVVFLLYLIVFFLLFLILSLMLKYHLENKAFEIDDQLKISSKK